MRIVLATLATPTQTSELYDHTISDMSEFYATRAFHCVADAIAWAQEQVDSHNEMWLDDEEEFRAIRTHSRTEKRPNLDANAVSPTKDHLFVFWAPAGDIESGNTEDSFCLHIWEQDL